MGLIDDIKAEKQGIKAVNPDVLLIEQELNKLFYIQPNYKAEIQMLKRQAALKSGDRYGLHASAILASDEKFCYREQVLSLFYKQCQGENIPIGLKRIFEEGNFIGEKWQRLFIRGGIGKAEDMDISRFVEEYDLSYTPDATIVLHGKRYIVETKSQNTFSFKRDKDHPAGKKQLRFYMFLERCKHGFVLVEDKNDQNFKVLPQYYGNTFGKDYIRPYIARLEAIQKYKRKFKRSNIMVEGICGSATCKRAMECNMRDACFNIGAGRVKLA